MTGTPRRKFTSCIRLISVALLGACAFVGTTAFSSVARADAQGEYQPPPRERFDADPRFSRMAPAGDFASLRVAAEAKGTVRVIIGLRTSFTPEGALPETARASQRASIAAATAAVTTALGDGGYRIIHTYETVPFIALEISASALSRLEASGLASSLHREMLMRPALSQSTGIVEAKEAATIGRIGSGRVVAVVDTGIASGHPFLQHAPDVSKVVSEACYSGNGNCPGGATQSVGEGSGAPCAWAPNRCAHGTHLAGIVAGKGENFSGVAPGAKLISIRVFSRFTGGPACAGQGEDPCAFAMEADVLKGLERVLNLSDDFKIAAALLAISEGTFTSVCDGSPLKAAIDNLRSVQIATIVPSGNNGFTNAVGSPGCISTAVTVGATDDDDVVALFSNSSAQVDFFAPGVDIRSSVPGGGFATLDGTSMAAAHVAGAFAIAKQVLPDVTADVISLRLIETGKPITDTAASPQITRDRIRVLSASANVRHSGFPSAANFGPLPGLGIASDGVGLARRTNANPNPVDPPPSANFVISGIPAGATIEKVYVVYQVLGAPDPTFKFVNNADRTANLVGVSGQFLCWNSTNNGGAYRTYRYVVPDGLVTGNGTYSIGGIGGTNHPIHGRSDGQGASLIIVYSKAGQSNGRAYLRFGSMTGLGNGPEMRYRFTGLDIPPSPTNRALHVGIGDGEQFADHPMQFAGTPITPANFWSGREGFFWDDDPIPLAANLLPSNATSRTVSQGAASECLTWTYAGLTFRN